MIGISRFRSQPFNMDKFPVRDCMITVCVFLMANIALSIAYAQSSPKNIVNIVLDDADYSDFSYNNYLLTQPDSVTPNLADLRLGGRLFPNYYTGSSFCSPTRVSLLTGCNPIRFGSLQAWPDDPTLVQGNLSTAGLPSNAVQLGLLMQRLGKTTGHFGKWHVGSGRPAYRPNALGFDEYGGLSGVQKAPLLKWDGAINFQSTANGYYTKDVDYVDEELTSMAGDFILRHSESPNGFFVNLWAFTPHFPWTPPRNFDNSTTQFDLSTNRGRVLAMMYSVDNQIGRIVELLDALGIREQTLIVVSSDNGGQLSVRNPSPFLYGGKGSLFEGGTKVSMIANWHGIEPNSTNYSAISSYDLLPTFVDLFMNEEPLFLYPLIDGRSKKSALFTDASIPHEPIYAEIQGSDKRTIDERAQKVYSLMDGRYRLTKPAGRSPLATRSYFLYDLQVAPSGRVNIAATNPSIVNRLKRQMRELRITTSQLTFPDTASNREVVVEFDPRFDTGRKEFSFVVDVNLSSLPVRASNILTRSGSFNITVLQDSSIRWTLNGTSINGTPNQQTLTTSPLSTGDHRLLFTSQGFKNANFPMHNVIYVDGQVAADSDPLLTTNPIYALWSTESGLTLGDVGLELSRVRFHTLRFWPDEIN